MRILHISDLHFGTREDEDDAGKPTGTRTVVHRWTRNTPTGEESNPKTLVSVLKDDELLSADAPDLVVATGDIGWSGTAEDYRIAEEFFTELRGTWPSVPIAILPGNHDVDLREPGPADHARQDGFIAFLRRVYDADFGRLYPVFVPGSRRTSLAYIEALDDKLILVGVNSAAFLHTRMNGQVVIAPQVLQDIGEHLGKLGSHKDALRVFALHHHVLPFAEGPGPEGYDPARVHDRPDWSLVANSAKLQTWLARHEFHLILHGHKHVSHGREDTLRKLHAPTEGHKVLVLGAGSAGVMAAERMHTEPLNFHVIDIDRVARRRWSVQVHIRLINEREIFPETRPLESYPVLELGAPLAHQPSVFCAERMDDCHRAIAAATSHGKLVPSFISVVETPHFYEMKTAQLNGHNVSTEQIEESFRALHPEYDESAWRDDEEIARVLIAPREDPRFQFKHGYRLFGQRGHSGRTPLGAAIEQLMSAGGTSKAYASLYDPEIDTQGGQEPIPGLMGVQFIPDTGNTLDIVMTFRKLELSFWWAVNMLEASRLLFWAAKKAKRDARRITFFAALAEWKKKDVEAAFVAKLDKIDSVALLEIALRAATASATDIDELRKLIADKIAKTNEVNFDPRGVRQLHDIASALHKVGQWQAGDGSRLVVCLGRALDLMDQARGAAPSKRTRVIEDACRELETVVLVLSRASAPV
ncbi:metallophosphoesterase family protein [Sorangium sp. So ce1182]|uniref:metallophosphoesterase family protein n=1 Tax=Sorangium sp. So ce1182 TaxID=3133334 RepID=UPI003F639A15